MMRRREFITLLGGAAAWPLAARAQQDGKLPRLGILSPGRSELPEPGVTMLDAFVQGLHELGYAEGRNLILERRYAEWRPERLRELAAELAGAGVDVIVAFATPAARAAKQATSAIPIVAVAVPVGFVWGEADGEVLLHPDEAVITAIRTIFARFAETGSARRVWLWFRDQGLQLPLQMSAHAEIRWVEASYHAVHQILSNPVYAGAYVYGKTRTETMLKPSGARRKRIKHLPRDQWQVLIKEHHRGYIDWQTYEANQQRIAKNTRPGPHKAGGAVREGSALLQGLASCGHCGRRLRTHYSGRNSTPGYHCSGEHLVEGRGSYCLNIGGVQIDDAVARAFLAALEPATIAATLAAAEQLEMDREATLKHWRLGVERASYAASLAERRYRAVDPDNRLVARGLERAWEESLRALETAKAELARRENERLRALSRQERGPLAALGPDLATVWHAATTTPRDRKELLGP